MFLFFSDFCMKTLKLHSNSVMIWIYLNLIDELLQIVAASELECC